MSPGILVALGLITLGGVGGAYFLLNKREEDVSPSVGDEHEHDDFDDSLDPPRVVDATDATPPGDVRLGPNFLLSEFTRSRTATELGIDNTPSARELANLRLLVEQVLQPLRTELGVPIKITSGFRSQALNDVLPNADSNSVHRFGLAADFKSNSRSSPDIMVRIRNGFLRGRMPVRQVILYDEARGGHIHASYAPSATPKGEFLHARAGRSGYVTWRS